jgi:hypothetical protein
VRGTKTNHVDLLASETNGLLSTLEEGDSVRVERLVARLGSGDVHVDGLGVLGSTPLVVHLDESTNSELDTVTVSEKEASVGRTKQRHGPESCETYRGKNQMMFQIQL